MITYTYLNTIKNALLKVRLVIASNIDFHNTQAKKCPFSIAYMSISAYLQIYYHTNLSLSTMVCHLRG